MSKPPGCQMSTSLQESQDWKLALCNKPADADMGVQTSQDCEAEVVPEADQESKLSLNEVGAHSLLTLQVEAWLQNWLWKSTTLL